MELPTKGTMRPLKKILGITLLVSGLGLIFMPDKTTAILCSNKAIFGIMIAIAGYFHLISGRQG